LLAAKMVTVQMGFGIATKLNIGAVDRFLAESCLHKGLYLPPQTYGCISACFSLLFH
jgi:hypothetical protein